MQEQQKAISLDVEIRREAQAFLEKEDEGTLDAIYGDGMFKRLSALAIKNWFPNDELSREIIEQFSRRAHWHLENIFSREVQRRRLEGDIAQCLGLTAGEIFGKVTHSAPQDQFAVLVFNEAGLLLSKAEEATPDNADRSYPARAFHRLAEAFLQHIPKENWPTEDISAIAQTAATHLGKTYMHSPQVQMAQLMNSCLQRAFAEEGRKVEFPVLDYYSIPEPDEEELEDYGIGFDPLRLHKFTQRILKDALYRVRGDESEIWRAIREFDETVFPEWKTREEYISSMDAWGWPTEIRERAITSFDETLAEQPEQTPEIVANLLRQRRNAMLNGRAETIFQSFMNYSDHGMRCGISATLFLALHYANADYLAVSKASEKEIDKARPTLTKLKEQVAKYFADWLTQPLVTKSKEGKKPIADLVKTKLRVEHDRVIDGWREASQMYKDAVKSRSDVRKEGWRNDVKRYFSQLDMPDDLIERLQPRQFWPAEIINTACKKGHDSSNPDDIALEHAARLCGAAGYGYRLSTLKQYLKTQRRSGISSAEFETPLVGDDAGI